jgi:hypothetical protein
MMSPMRLLLAVVVSFLFASVTASAAQLDPQTLVLRQEDVPAGFELDRNGSGLRTNESEAKGDRRLPGLLERWGRVTGYETEYDRREATLTSRADLFRTPEGSELMMAYVVGDARKSGIKGLRRSPAQIGAGGWLYGGGSGSGAFNLVIWRHQRVFAGLVAFGVQKGRMLALARGQQRRIAAALG